MDKKICCLVFIDIIILLFFVGLIIHEINYDLTRECHPLSCTYNNTGTGCTITAIRNGEIITEYVPYKCDDKTLGSPQICFSSYTKVGLMFKDKCDYTFEVVFLSVILVILIVVFIAPLIYMCIKCRKNYTPI